MEFIVIAHDDPIDGKAKRAAAREDHLAVARDLANKGNLLNGGALLDDNGDMVGSMILMEFDSRADLDQWLNNDPYVTGGVWTKITVNGFKRFK